MGRIALLASTLLAAALPSHAAETQSDIAAVLITVPGEGAAHHALVKRQGDESLNDLFDRAFKECGDARCRVFSTWQRGDCVSLVQGKKFIYWAWGAALDEPQKRAMTMCNGAAETCTPLTSECYPK